jgi:hypothetical protein
MPHSSKGYQLVEDNFTSAIVHYPDKQLPSMVLAWFVELLRQEPALVCLPIEIELIVAQYVSKYPCIGVHYLTPALEDVEPLILSLLSTYRESRTFGEFHEFLLTHQEAIIAFQKKLEEA